MKQPAIYIIASQKNGTLYTGVTSNLPKRIWEHKEEVIKGFTSRHGCKILVYYEAHYSMENAICREKQIKDISREDKLKLIESFNPDWNDLYNLICN